MTQATNPYCERLGIAVPSLAAVRSHPDANTYAMLIVALLQRGRPMTLADVALDFHAAGVVDHPDDAYFSLSRCRPARAPVYRDGDLYALDPYDDELDLWAFRLGLRPPRVARAAPPPPPPRPLPSQPLTLEELDRAWRDDANLMNWSAQRIALAVLDAHARPMTPDEVVSFVAARTKWHSLRPGPQTFRRRGSAVSIGDDGTWSPVPGAAETIMARDAVRDAVARTHRYPRSTPEQIAESTRSAERRRTAHADELAKLRRVIIHAFPSRAPSAVVLLDVEQRQLTTLIGDQLEILGERLRDYDLLAGVDIRATLRELSVDPRDRRLAELGPPQKSMTLNKAGRTLKITTAMLIQGSCGISRPLGDEDKLRGYLAKGQLAQFQRGLEADAKAIFALYQYGKTHGCVRLRWGVLDDLLPAPWHHRDEPMLYHLLREARGLGMGIIAVVGSAPGWEDPWSRARRLEVIQGASEYDLLLRDEHGAYVDERDVQLARLEAVVH
ncbi:MAG: hypothetical protein JNL83_21290 [Myxococcales bacterium]|nr:hypothetical protein [Myxococcales bacterium]